MRTNLSPFQTSKLGNNFHINNRAKYRLKLLALAAPCVLLVLAFYYVPIFGWSYAFFEYIPGLSIFKMHFAGFSYFHMIFSGGSEIVPVLRNTLILGGLIVLTIPIPVVFAITLSEMRSVRLSKFVQTVSTIPYFISFVLVFAVVYALFATEDGFVNILISKLHLLNHPLNPLADSNMAWFFQTLLHLIVNTGYSAIVYIAAISGIDNELYNAAEIDGADRLRRIWHVTLPGIQSAIFVILILNIANILTASGFGQYYVFLNPLVADKIDVIDTYSYTIGITQNNYAFATAIGMSKSLISIGLLFFANLMSKIVRGSSII